MRRAGADPSGPSAGGLGSDDNPVFPTCMRRRPRGRRHRRGVPPGLDAARSPHAANITGGKGNALAAGFARVPATVVMFDADGSADPAEIERFVEALQGADFAKGSRFTPGGGSADITPCAASATVPQRRVQPRLPPGYTDLCYGYNAFWADLILGNAPLPAAASPTTATATTHLSAPPGCGGGPGKRRHPMTTTELPSGTHAASAGRSATLSVKNLWKVFGPGSGKIIGSADADLCAPTC